jgi:hypothetical protein
LFSTAGFLEIGGKPIKQLELDAAELHYDAALNQDGAVGRFFVLGATYRF